jgi:hypothetical protein
MKKYQKTLLAGVAALALVAGTGLASAQQSNEHMGGAGAAKSASPPAGQSMSRQGAQAQEKGKATQTQAQEKGKATQTQAQEKGKTNANETAQTGNKESTKNPGGQAAQNKMGQPGANLNARAERTNRGAKNSRQNTAEQQRALKGLQGNAAKPMQGQAQQGSNPNAQGGTPDKVGAQPQGTDVQLSDQQRTRIKQTVIDARNAPRVGHVDFDVRVGTAIPRAHFHVVPVPETLVRIEPRWRGFLYFVYEDEVVIVNPRDMRIVAVLPV